MNPAEEKALKALNDVTEELRLMQELTCETSEEEQVRASEIEKLVASVEERSEDLAREQRSAAALAKVESVKSQVTKTGLVRSTPEKKTEIRAIDKKKLHRCFDGDYEGAHALGRYVQSIAGVQARAASAYPQASVDSIAAYGSGENATTFPTSMSALVMDTLYNGLINEVAYTALCPQLARTFNVPTNGLQIPIADEAPYAKFYAELAHIDPVQPVVNAAQLVLHKMAHLNYCSSELLEDTIYAAGYVIETFSNSFAKTIDNVWLQGNAGIGVEGLCDAIEGYDSGANVITAAEEGKISPDEASMAVMLTYRNTQNPAWLVSPVGWASVMAHVVTPESGAIMTGGVAASLYGSPVYLSYELPEDVLAVHGSFSQACAYGTKPRGVKIISSDTRAMEFDASTFMGQMRCGWNNHSPQFCTLIKDKA